MDASLDGMQTHGRKGLPYDWQVLLIPDEPGFSDAIATLLRDADSPELTADAAS